MENKLRSTSEGRAQVNIVTLGLILVGFVAACGTPPIYYIPHFATLVDAESGTPVCNAKVSCSTTTQGEISPMQELCPNSDAGDRCEKCRDDNKVTCPSKSSPAHGIPCGTLTIKVDAPGYVPTTVDAGYFDCDNGGSKRTIPKIQLKRSAP